MMQKEVYFRKTRKIYYWFYLVSAFLVGYYVSVRFHGEDIKTPIVIAGVIFILGGIKLIEVGRLHNLYGFNSQYVFHKRGFFRKRIKKVFLGRISDLVLSRGILNTIFNYGNVEVHHFGGSGIIEVKKINNPQKFIEDLQEMINQT